VSRTRLGSRNPRRGRELTKQVPVIRPARLPPPFRNDPKRRGRASFRRGHNGQSWTREPGVDKEQLRKLVDRFGNSAAAVRKQPGLPGSPHRWQGEARGMPAIFGAGTARQLFS
jgi:hypothetical protein